MIKPVYTTNPQYIKYLDCNPGVYKRVVFQSCNLDIREGSSVLNQVSLCDFNLQSLGSSELGGCGGVAKKSVMIKTQSNYILTAPEVGQAQGEVQLIVVKAKYDTKQDPATRFLTWEYKGNVYPMNTLMVLTGRTEAEIPWQGWDLSYYSNNPPAPQFSPHVYPTLSSPDLTFGGIMFTNPGGYSVDLEIFVFN